MTIAPGMLSAVVPAAASLCGVFCVLLGWAEPRVKAHQGSRAKRYFFSMSVYNIIERSSLAGRKTNFSPQFGELNV